MNEKVKENADNLNNTLVVTENCYKNINNVNKVMDEVGEAVVETEEEVDKLTKVSQEIFIDTTYKDKILVKNKVQ